MNIIKMNLKIFLKILDNRNENRKEKLGEPEPPLNAIMKKLLI